MTSRPAYSSSIVCHCPDLDICAGVDGVSGLLFGHIIRADFCAVCGTGLSKGSIGMILYSSSSR